MQRGRPKSIERLPENEPRIFSREYLDEEGIKHVWKFNLDITPRGPISTELFYPANYKSKLEIQEKNNSYLPHRLQEFFHPTTGKVIGYARAHALGVI